MFCFLLIQKWNDRNIHFKKEGKMRPSINISERTIRLKEHPAWRNALNEVLERVEEEGYGIMFTHEELMEYFDIIKPEQATSEEWKTFQFSILSNVDKLRTELLEEHNMYLECVVGEGYRIMEPKEQVKHAPTRHLKKACKQIKYAWLAMTHVDLDKLDGEHERLRLRGLEKIAFLKMQMGKKILNETKDETS